MPVQFRHKLGTTEAQEAAKPLRKAKGSLYNSHRALNPHFPVRVGHSQRTVGYNSKVIKV